MATNVYLDESGDMGWTFDKPYRYGGSSRYLTIAFIICPSEKKHFPKRIVKDVYIKLKAESNKEIKGSSLSIASKEYIVRKTINLLTKHPDIIIGAITVSKENVMSHIREDSNKLYNYMLKLSLIPKLPINIPLVNLIRDNRSVKVKSGNCLIDYLQTTLWFDIKSNTKIIDIPSDSKSVDNLIFIDWINNIIWGHHEDGNSSAFNILAPKIQYQSLFF